MNDRIERVGGHIVAEEVAQTIARMEFSTVESNCEAGIKIGVVLNHGLDILLVEFESVENGIVGDELNESSVLFR